MVDKTYFDTLIDCHVPKYINLKLFYVILAIILIILIIFVAELTAYIWHRYISHEEIIKCIRQTHLDHHQANWLHEAHEDFLWIVIGLIIFTVIILFIYFAKIAPALLLFIIWFTVLTIFIWNWYIHMAYHQPHHWLEQYNWFNYDRKMHLIHHVNPRKNYGMASHFSDWGLGTFESVSSYSNLYPSKNIYGTGIIDT